MTGYHCPVLEEEIKKCFAPIKTGVIVDGTVGGGGHAAAILALSPGFRLLGLDKDPDALRAAGENLLPFGGRARFFRGGFEALPEVLDQMQVTTVQGVLLDLGLSSFQVDQEARGFAYAKDGPLDMRFSKEGFLTAESVVNGYPRHRLESVFRELGEERRAGPVAAAVVRARERAPLRSTGALARVVSGVCRGSVKSLARIFQALRIEVNGELEALRRSLSSIPARISPGGRFAVISYHSLEDRMVKRAFSSLCQWIDRGRFRLPGDEAGGPQWRSLTKKAVRPAPSETAVNPRARSAKLRAVERL